MQERPRLRAAPLAHGHSTLQASSQGPLGPMRSAGPLSVQNSSRAPPSLSAEPAGWLDWQHLLRLDCLSASRALCELALSRFSFQAPPPGPALSPVSCPLQAPPCPLALPSPGPALQAPPRPQALPSPGPASPGPALQSPGSALSMPLLLKQAPPCPQAPPSRPHLCPLPLPSILGTGHDPRGYRAITGLFPLPRRMRALLLLVLWSLSTCSDASWGGGRKEQEDTGCVCGGGVWGL